MHPPHPRSSEEAKNEKSLEWDGWGFKSKLHHLEAVACALAPPDLKDLFLLWKGPCLPCRGKSVAAEACTGARLPRSAQERVRFLSLESLSHLSGIFQHLSSISSWCCLEAEGQQESPEPVPYPQILAGTCLGCGIQWLGK